MSTTATLLDMASPTASTAASQPPIFYFLEVASRFLTICVSALSHVSILIAWLTNTVFKPIGFIFVALSSPILYLLSPAFLFINLVMNIFIYTPYNALVLLMHALYPLYSFLFVAVAFATVIAFSARIGAYLAKLLLLYPQQVQKLPATTEVSMKTAPQSGGGNIPKRQVRIKEEGR